MKVEDFKDRGKVCTLRESPYRYFRIPNGGNAIWERMHGTKSKVRRLLRFSAHETTLVPSPTITTFSLNKPIQPMIRNFFPEDGDTPPIPAQPQRGKVI